MSITRWETAQVDPCPECCDAEPIFDGFLTAAEGEWCKWEDVAPLQARVAELESENKQLCDRDIEANAALVSYESRIARAVAELAPMAKDCFVSHALAILRGETK